MVVDCGSTYYLAKKAFLSLKGHFIFCPLITMADPSVTFQFRRNERIPNQHHHHPRPCILDWNTHSNGFTNCYCPELHVYSTPLITYNSILSRRKAMRWSGRAQAGIYRRQLGSGEEQRRRQTKSERRSRKSASSCEQARAREGGSARYRFV